MMISALKTMNFDRRALPRGRKPRHLPSWWISIRCDFRLIFDRFSSEFWSDFGSHFEFWRALDRLWHHGPGSARRHRWRMLTKHFLLNHFDFLLKHVDFIIKLQCRSTACPSSPWVVHCIYCYSRDASFTYTIYYYYRDIQTTIYTTNLHASISKEVTPFPGWFLID